jgi:AraC-like DNA-binding protein
MMKKNTQSAIVKELTIDVSGLKKILDLLGSLFNIRTAFLYEIEEEAYLKEIAGNNGDFRPYCTVVQKELKHKCIACDNDKFKIAFGLRRSLLYRCYNGLYEMFLPLLIDNVVIGYLHFGQVRSSDSFEQIVKECSLDAHSQVEKLKFHYNEMEAIPELRLNQIAELFSTIADSILKSNLIEIKRANAIYYVKKFIEENSNKRITIKDAAKFVGRSESYLTHEFKKLHNCTFHEYLTNKRIIVAKQLLKLKSIDETFEECGFKNRYHFSRMFKKVTGFTPKEFQDMV